MKGMLKLTNTDNEHEQERIENQWQSGINKQAND